ncbi:hypothetical protein QA601_03790 [Chitinispirillales bacterium ANBcel5]|uniref:hypothetical protein n=1 Tax=Cellulosispirillum alkaliphilum TaxID=3039283 RepID=UPI002A569088|nr:hypothetical protein [Chitinispirillales bacterium ANBcel5]
MGISGKFLKNSHGSTIVGVLASLVFIGIVTTFMTSMMSSDSRDSRVFSSMQVAKISSNNALRATESFLSIKPNTSVTVLNEFIEETNVTTLLEERIGKNQTIISQIAAFSTSELIAKIKGSGKGSSGSPRTTAAFYQLEGIRVVTNQVKNALYLSGPARNFNRSFTVRGDVFFGSSATLNKPGSTIEGNLKWVNASPDGEVNQLTGLTVTGNVFINSERIYMQNEANNFRGATAFQQPISAVNNTHNIYDDVYIGDGVTDFNGEINLFYRGSVSYWGPNYTANRSQFNEYVSIQEQHISDIAARVGMVNEPDREPVIDIKKIPEKYINNVSILGFQWDVTGPNVQSAFENWPLWRDQFLVIRIPEGTHAGINNAPQDNYFYGRVIFIVDGTFNINHNRLYTSGHQSNTLFYVSSTGNINQFGTDGVFRGMTYVEPGGNITYDFGNNGEGVVEGAVHHHGNADFNSNGVLNINYNTEVLAELSDLGIFTNPNDKDNKSGTVELISETGTIDALLLGSYQF